MHSILVQGPRIAGPAELDALAREFSALHLQQPAALVIQIQQHIAAGEVKQKDAESLIKILQILSQAEIQLSEAETIDLEHLREGYHGVYVPFDKTVQAASDDLNAILMITNPYLRGRQLIEYFQKASYDELVQSLEIIWFDYTLSNFIAEGLQTRPEEAIKLAQIALKHKNRVIWRTALNVLEKVGKQPSCRQEVLTLLTDLAEKANKSSKWTDLRLLKPIIARIEGTYEDYLAQNRQIHRYLAANVKRLDSSKKNERYTGIYALLRAEDPYFTDMLVRALVAEDDQKIIRLLLRGLVDINGFEAIPYIVQMLGGPHTKQALEALTRFGDRSVLTYLFNGIPSKLALSFYKNSLPQYRLFAVNPLISTIKTLEYPDAYKSEFATIFATLRSESLVQGFVAYAEHDAGFADKLFALMRKLYPKQVKKTDSHTLKPSMQQMLGGIHIDKKDLLGLLVTPDGKYLLTLAHGKWVGILDTVTWKQQTSLKTEGYPMSFNLSPDGKYILTAKWIIARREYVVEIWEFGRWQVSVGSFGVPDQVHAVALTSDNRFLLVGHEKGVKVVEFGSWRDVTDLTEHEERVTYIQSIPGRHITLTGRLAGLVVRLG